jgi:hypothetical protein
MRFVTSIASDRLIRPVGCRRLTALLIALFVLMGVSSLFGQQPERETPFRLIGATATVTESSSGLPFMARVDTGATTCSIHCEAMEIEDASDDAKENIGKPIRFLVKNKKGQAKWLTAIVADYGIVRTSEQADWRYKVQLELRWQDIEKTVLVTLNDRAHMKYPVLIGRNFLRNDFLVNVAWEGHEALTQIAAVTQAATANDPAAVTNAVPTSDALAANDAAVDAP